MKHRCPNWPIALLTVLCLSAAVPQDGQEPALGWRVARHAKISSTAGGFLGPLQDGDVFGYGIAPLGDLDGDGVDDLAVGATGDDDGGMNRGAVWTLLMNADGTVKESRKISVVAGTLLEDYDSFGASIACLGDVDGDGMQDLAVGAPRDHDGTAWNGAVWILFLNTDGTVKTVQKISEVHGGFTGHFYVDAHFGRSVAALDDLDGDGIRELAVGAPGDSAGCAMYNCIGDPSYAGSVFILFLNPDGTVRSQREIDSSQGGFTGCVMDGDIFGTALAALGDLDGDGVCDLAVGAPGDCSLPKGSVWVLFLNPDGTVKSHQRLAEGMGGVNGPLYYYFGADLAALGDLDGDGVCELAVGQSADPGGGASDRGAVFLLFLRPDGTVKLQRKIGDALGGFSGVLDDDDYFGYGLAPLGDFDGNGVPDVAVGAPGDDDGGDFRGAVWLLSLELVKHKPANVPPDSGGTIVLPNQVGAPPAPIRRE